MGMRGYLWSRATLRGVRGFRCGAARLFQARLALAEPSRTTRRLASACEMMRSPAAAAKRRHDVRLDPTSDGRVVPAATDTAAGARVRQTHGEADARGATVRTAERVADGVSDVQLASDGSGAPRAAASVAAAPGAVHSMLGSRDERLMPRHAKKKQRLVEKALTRPSAAVMRFAPVGAAQIHLAPKLSDFRDAAGTDGERRRLHSEAMLAWLQANVSKSAIQRDTQVSVRARTANGGACGKHFCRFGALLTLGLMLRRGPRVTGQVHA